MKIELKNVKYAAFASQETSCFDATIWIDGAKAGTVSNDGQGGSNRYNPYGLEEQLDAHAATLPPLPADPARGFPEMEQNADIVICHLLTAWLTERDAKRNRPSPASLQAMRELFAGKDRVANRVAKVSVPHIRRCAKAGLIIVAGDELVLTDSGRQAVR